MKAVLGINATVESIVLVPAAELATATLLKRDRLVALGPAVAILAWIAASLLFSFYVARFSSYDKAWGSLSAVVVTIVWLWLGATALLLGAEIDARVSVD